MTPDIQDIVKVPDGREGTIVFECFGDLLVEFLDVNGNQLDLQWYKPEQLTVVVKFK